jgi:hypothetical protein
MFSKASVRVAVSVIAICFASPAMADVDPNKVSEAVTALMKGYGLQIKATSAEGQGANVVLKGLTFTAPEGTDVKQIGDLTLNNVSETPDGFLIGEISAPAKAYPVKDGTWNFGGASVKNITLPAAGNTDPTKQIILYETAEMGASKFTTTEGKDFITFAGAKATVTNADGQKVAFDMAAPEIKINTAAIPNNDPQFTAAMEEFGLTNLEMQVSAKGSWSLTDGRIAITEETFAIKNAGKLNFTADISGYTPQLAASLRDMITSSAGKSDAEMGAKMMGLVGQITLNGVSLRFDDESIAGKALDFIAKQSGQPKEALVAQAKGMAPLMLMQLQDPDFSVATTNAISAFLDNPKNLEIKIAPAAPVPVSQIIASGMAAPATLVKQLGLQVVANQ